MFRHRPLSVTEPFGLAAPRTLHLAEIAREHDAAFIHDGLAEVRPDDRLIETDGGRRLEYDCMLIAIGARGTDTIPGAPAFRDSVDQGFFRRLLADLSQGAVHHLAFAVPHGISWPLGLYELALLTRAHLREQGLENVSLTLVTPEARPMEIFGRRASAVVGDVLAEAEVVLRLDCKPIRYEAGHLIVKGGEPIACDRAISLPAPRAAPIPGIPQQRHGGFIPVDRYGGVLGLERVFAAGDVTWFPVKQGGLAAQQADCAASAIAALAGAPVDPQPFRPVLRGALLTGSGPRYLRAPYGESAPGTAARSPLWWPPAKVAGKYLAPYLAARTGYAARKPALADLEPPPGEAASSVASSHEDVLAVALSFADEQAGSRDFPGALRWLEVAENLELYLPPEYELKRRTWQDSLGRSNRPQTPSVPP